MTRLRLGLLAACALATLACESPPPRRRAKRPTESQPRTGQVATSGGSSKSVRLPPGHVAFAFEDADLENTDFTDAYIGQFDAKKICKNPTLKGENPKTGAPTKESLGCGAS